VFADWLDEQGRAFEAAVQRHLAGRYVCVYFVRNKKTKQIIGRVHESIPGIRTSLRLNQLNPSFRPYGSKALLKVEHEVVVVPLMLSEPIAISFEDFDKASLPASFPTPIEVVFKALRPAAE
jgi:hypothetical protein